MSRPLRIECPNAWHHVMNRARRGQMLFVDKDDYTCFLDLLRETSEIFNIKIFAYCLMPTHYHLLVQTPEMNLARCMRHLNGVFTQRYNIQQKCDGTLFRGRYKSILVEEDSYLLQLVRYIPGILKGQGLLKNLISINGAVIRGMFPKQKSGTGCIRDLSFPCWHPKKVSR